MLLPRGHIEPSNDRHVCTFNDLLQEHCKEGCILILLIYYTQICYERIGFALNEAAALNCCDIEFWLFAGAV
jgi:hypothetical protein